MAIRTKAKSVLSYVNKNPALISIPALGIAGTNLAVNVNKQNKNIELQGQQLKAMNNLTKSLNNVDGTIKKSINNTGTVKPEQKRDGSILSNLFNKNKR
jgi:hypothetical protein